jgi:hypothetical protein
VSFLEPTDRTFVETICEHPAELISGKNIHNRHQVEEFLLQADIGDFGRPRLILCRYGADIDETEALRWLFKASDRSLVNSCDAWVSHPPMADRDLFSDQVLHHPAGTAARILEVERINPGHDPQH